MSYEEISNIINNSNDVAELSELLNQLTEAFDNLNTAKV